MMGKVEIGLGVDARGTSKKELNFIDFVSVQNVATLVFLFWPDSIGKSSV